MQSVSRRFKHCMFCGATDVTKEHIWGKSLSKRFPKQNSVSVRRSAYSEERRGGGYNPLSMTSKSMCRNCNNGLGPNMNIVTAPLADVIKGSSDNLIGIDSRTVVNYFQRIGALLDLETAEFDASIMYESSADIRSGEGYRRGPPVLGSDERHKIGSGALIERVVVFLGRHYGRCGKDYEMTFSDHLDISTDLYGTRKRFIFSIECLTGLICIGNGSYNRNEYLTRLLGIEPNIRLDPNKVSSDWDVAKNLSPFTQHLDGSMTLTIQSDD